MKHLLGLRDLSKEEILKILNLAKDMKLILKSETKKTPHLQGYSVVTLFYENSTRTRTSFELAAKFMSANTTSISVATSSVQKGESLLDTVRTLEALKTDVLIVRHSVSGAAHFIAKNCSFSVINAGDGMNEHPTQALLDMFTIRERLGKLEKLKIAIIGDILHSRVARSNIWGLKKFENEVTVYGPRTLLPPFIDKFVNVASSLEEAVCNKDVVIDLRIQLERQKRGLISSKYEYYEFFGLNEDISKFISKDTLIMHPGPVNRGVEISSEIMNLPNCTIEEQVTNGIAVRMAVLYLCTRKEVN
ncbi:aspartate carbamoyltransferase catalytic subunit [Caldicellulosiruptor morganii]|uniref:Aspartate carbamoyltransferase n=1 Tax=Caldicellulosiruptor morganii TaxID=1387555 RepID=A0ABY7BJ05_9FIRM|nr:aspartate carbamoyltransferase catalytic subunit [Caldicellulosiruptor morganii]WAM32815.1 aspartate carbamoyltransferase catalytic subunit [Caldicellulosiruptor morganii]